jgi:hypothetical protein
MGDYALVQKLWGALGFQNPRFQVGDRCMVLPMEECKVHYDSLTLHPVLFMGFIDSSRLPAVLQLILVVPHSEQSDFIPNGHLIFVFRI